MKNPASATPRRLVQLYWLAMFISLIGLGDAIYLTVHHITGRSVKCTVASGCSAVLGSAYATIADIPIAALGALAYFVAFSLATLAAFGYVRARTWLALVIAPMLISTLWLLYLQAFVLRAYCDYCLLSAAMTLMLTAVVVVAYMTDRGR
ncbi:MAG: vitamin K epoxide reductase family protein [Acidobacteria bacterium]|nr:vitamin K epoxide reductase family protein [Acidobacteriota bacterium]